MGTIATRVKDATYSVPALQALDRFIALLADFKAFAHIRATLQQLSDKARAWQASLHDNNPCMDRSPDLSPESTPADGDSFPDQEQGRSDIVQENDLETLKRFIKVRNDEAGASNVSNDGVVRMWKWEDFEELSPIL